MKININQIPVQGLIVEEDISAGELDLQTDEIKYREPVKIRAEVFRITNAVNVNLLVTARMYRICSRCLEQICIEIKNDFQLSYQVSAATRVIDLNSDIREEILLGYEINPLCMPGCKGLCYKCGKNLNEGECSCKDKN